VRAKLQLCAEHKGSRWEANMTSERDGLQWMAPGSELAPDRRPKTTQDCRKMDMLTPRSFPMPVQLPRPEALDLWSVETETSCGRVALPWGWLGIPVICRLL